MRNKQKELIELVEANLRERGALELYNATEAIYQRELSKPETDEVIGILEETGKYVISNGRNGNLTIKRNPNYDTNQSVIATNISVSTTNLWLKRMAIASTIIAAITGTFIGLDWAKDASPDLQPLYKQLEQTRQLLDSMQKFQKGIDSSLRIAVKNSLYH